MKEVRDIVSPNLTVLFVGFNPGLRSAQTGRHFAGPANKFWKLLHLSGLTPYQLKASEDDKLLEYNCGIINIVNRPTRSAAEIAKEEFRQGRIVVQEKLALFRPRIAAYAGIGVYKEFSGLTKIACGRQPQDVIPGIIDFVLPSPSGLNRMLFNEQLAYYQELRELCNTLHS